MPGELPALTRRMRADAAEPATAHDDAVFVSDAQTG
jgi:hypothetical protein